MHIRCIIWVSASLLLLLSCQNQPGLPVLSKEKTVEGKTVYETIPNFRFLNQDSQWVTPQTFAGKAYVADFFFTSCPTICPIMTKNMLELYREFEGESRLRFLSHTIDPARDSVARLKAYASNIGVDDQRWHFVTGKKDSLYAIADDYFNVVIEDPNLPDGFDHSGRFVLVDPQGHIRAYCNGTKAEEVQSFKEDIKTLLNEMEDTAPNR